MAKPVISCEVYDTSTSVKNLTGDSSVLVRYASLPRAIMYAQAQGGASINLDMCLIKNGKQTIFGTSGDFEFVESDTFTFSCEDSNGESARLVYTAPMVMYFPPTCNIERTRPNLSGVIDLKCSGNFFNGSFGVKANEVKQCSFRYREAGGTWSSYIDMSYSVYDGGYNATASLTGLDPNTAYDFEIYFRDSLKSVIAENLGVRAIPIFHWSLNDVTFEENVNLNKNLYLNGDGSSGHAVYFGSDYCSIEEYPVNVLNIRAYKEIAFDTPKFTHDGYDASLALYGTWIPILIGASPTYSEKTGWYSKTGNVVTVGFRIKASNFSSGDYQRNIQIGYLPFDSDYPASGGGLCSGAFMQTNQNFQCFVADSDIITVRSQACDETSGYDLATSASGCKYPSSTSGTLTLSGTITYMTND